MVVQHNLRAMNSNRMLGLTQSQQAKSSEKLSSGYKINRAADDAAGLSISEKMRKQIRGLTQASLNAQDGISAVQTAEGALHEVQDMLQRMNELAVKAANGTMSEDDRGYIQNEIDQLVTEIDRVAETTKFNETYLLKGNAEGTTSEKTVNAHDAGLAGKLIDNGANATFELKDPLEIGSKITIGGQEYTIGNQDASVKDPKEGLKSTAELIAVANPDDFGKKVVSFGDSIYDESANATYTLVNKIGFGTLGNGLTGDYALTDEKSAFTITHADGTVMSYNVSATAGTGVLDAKDAAALIEKELKAGSTVVLTKDKNGAAIANGGIEIVSALKNTTTEKEISISGTFADREAPTFAEFRTAANVTLAAKDTVTIGGEVTTATANKVTTIEDMNSVIGKLKATDTVTIKRDDKNGVQKTATYTVADETNELANEYTVADIQAMLQSGDQVQFDDQTNTGAGGTNVGLNAVLNSTGLAETTDYHVVGASANTASDNITKEKAYELIAKELEKASSIGVKEGKEATVVNNKNGSFIINKGKTDVVDNLTFGLHVGADADMTNKISLSLSAMDTASLGVKGLKVDGTTGTAATYAVDAIADAIQQISTQRSALGAVQNRLEHTINNLDNVVENTTAAESQIRDTDMASEMVKFSNNNILAQAGQAMLAQSNQANQGVLALLQ